MSTKKREYELIFEPMNVRNDEKLTLLNDSLNETCDTNEMMKYLSSRAHVYGQRHQWNDALNDISIIETLNDGKLSNALKTLKTESNVHVDLEKMRLSPRSKKTISKRSYTIQIRPVLRAVFFQYNRGSNTAVCSIEYDNVTPALRGFTADIRCPCTAVILSLLKRLNTALNGRFTAEYDAKTTVCGNIMPIYGGPF
ncbi:unnamed protein product [Rotaria socialis]|uniref:Uncharacterized protein n=1 Tax=Rotaria socialis TaxID=392032 RepID=A0A821H1W0_9BILA|nr:unnamed protein product [Rotaria socialis]CAF4676245.1 unnamed protein product [Rotaria socialis]